MASTTQSDDAETATETTTQPYRISRAELGKILNRNFRGLQKLLRIELNDAMNVSVLQIFEKIKFLHLLSSKQSTILLITRRSIMLPLKSQRPR